MKFLIFICSLAFAKAGVITTNYAPAPAVSTFYSSIHPAHQVVTPVVAKTITPVTHLAAPAPVYESVLTTHESRTKNFDGTQQTTFAKSLNTPHSSIQKYDSRVTNNGFVAHSVPVFSNTVAHPLTTYNVAAPVVHTVPSSVSYTAHNPVITKTLAPVTAVHTPSLTTYASHTPVVAQPAVKITYSEAPLVSHMTFTGLGTSYSW